MREIKFRAWDGSKMYTIDLYKYMSWHEGAQDREMPHEARTNGLMQYTGLKDKNGVEIYEGDLVKFGSPRKTFTPLEPASKVGEVMYVYGSFNLDGNLLGDVTDWHECEVIGNIYENPDLLGAK